MKTFQRLTTALALAAAACAVHAQKSVDYLETSKAWGALAADFNGDGHDDIFVSGHDSDDRIWYWTPTGYVPANWTLPWVDRHDCIAADVNKDGRLDFFCAIGGEKGYSSAKANELWIQQANGTFAKAVNTGLEDATGRGRRPVFLDLNHDGWPDVYLTNEATTRTDGLPNWNHMYLNNKDGTFSEVQTIATGKANSMLPGWACAVKGDVDGDGWDDLLVCYEKGPGHIYLNNHQNDFTALNTPAIGKGWNSAQLVDMNGDGKQDLVVLTTDNHLQVWLNTGVAPYFTTAAFDFTLTARAMWLTVGDFNGDGKPDVYVVLASDCNQAGPDNAPDVLFKQVTGPSWTMSKLNQSFGGCGYMATTVDGNKVLLENGTQALIGPNFLLGFGTN